MTGHGNCVCGREKAPGNQQTQAGKEGALSPERHVARKLTRTSLLNCSLDILLVSTTSALKWRCSLFKTQYNIGTTEYTSEIYYRKSKEASET